MIIPILTLWKIFTMRKWCKYLLMQVQYFQCMWWNGSISTFAEVTTMTVFLWNCCGNFYIWLAYFLHSSFVVLKLLLLSCSIMQSLHVLEVKAFGEIIQGLRLTKGPVTRCTFSCDLHRNSTVEKCEIGKYESSSDSPNKFFTHQTVFTNLHVLKLRCKLQEKLHRATVLTHTKRFVWRAIPYINFSPMRQTAVICIYKVVISF